MSLIPKKKDPKGLSPRRSGTSDPFSLIRSEIDDLFGRFLADPWGASLLDPGGGGGWSPSVDVAEDEKEVVVRAEIPGVDPKALDVSVSGGVLTLRGEKKDSREERTEGFYRSERRFGAFRRDVELPTSADAEKIAAEYSSGVLTVRFGKLPGAQPRKVKVVSR